MVVKIPKDISTYCPEINKLENEDSKNNFKSLNEQDQIIMNTSHDKFVIIASIMFDGRRINIYSRKGFEK